MSFADINLIKQAKLAATLACYTYLRDVFRKVSHVCAATLKPATQ